MARACRTVSSVQLKAVFIILLLAGAEAHRITDQAKIAKSALGTLEQQNPFKTSYEKEWAKENKACEWSTVSMVQGKGGCVGTGCSYRRLPLDLPPPSSQSCRLTDEFMLESERRSDFVTMQAGLLKSKAMKYRLGECSGSSLSPWCVRRLRTMMRAVKFIAKAQKDEDRGFAKQSDEQRAEQSALIDSALKGVAQSHGENGKIILELRRKLTANNGEQLKQNPRATTLRVVALLTSLLQGTPEEQAEAKDAITRMSDAGGASIPLPPDMERAIAEGENDAIEAKELLSSKLSEEASMTEDSQEERGEVDMALNDAFDGQLDEIESSLEGSTNTIGSMEVVLAAALPVDEQGESSLLERDGSANNRSGSAKDRDEEIMYNYGLSHTKRNELMKELVKLGMDFKQAKHRATQVLKYEKGQQGVRILTTFMWILTIGVVVMAALFAVVEIIAALVYWILFGLIGCSSYAALYNWRVGDKDWKDNSTTAAGEFKEFQGKMTGKDIMRCSAKAIWIFVYAPLVAGKYAVKLAIGVVLLPFWLITKVVGLFKGKKKSGESRGKKGGNAKQLPGR
eukprot:TRINITY_DN3776_c0_g1_i1.p1 TRINITY_DN3776_c0_g1~~TRINITY_DN3776_c0_g1_i1.p1  ORF type:complete len:569 (-),score=122.68 TRINITY_DN3776_c0_g1_i1:171-1877(-)